MEGDRDRYKIIRFYFDENRENKVIKKGLTLEQAKEHCNDPATSKKTGNSKTWFFDGFYKQ